MFNTLINFVAAFVAVDLPPTPAQAVCVAIAFHDAIDPALRNQTKLLIVPGGDVALRQQNAMALSYLLNSVNRSRVIVVPKPTDNTWKYLIVDLAAYADVDDEASYAQLFEEWERLAQTDPYFHLRTEVVAAGETSPKVVTVDGGWVGIDEAKKLRELSGSFGAVLRGDYFASLVAQDNYYEWAGIPETEAEFVASLGLNVKDVDRLAGDAAANLTRSKVSLKFRRVIFRPSVLGATFQTKDVDRQTPDADPLRNPISVGTQRFNFQASEWFAAGPTGLWLTALYDADGKRQATVPDTIAKDRFCGAYGDGIVRPFLTCVRCHELNGGAGGLQPFDDDQAFLLSRAFVAANDPGTVQRIAEAYDPARMGKAMARAREDYEDAVALATGGLTPPVVVNLLNDIVVNFRDKPVTPATAAYELAVPLEAFSEVLASSNDPNLLLLVAGREINRAAWESSYPQAAVMAAEYHAKGVAQ